MYNKFKQFALETKEAKEMGLAVQTFHRPGGESYEAFVQLNDDKRSGIAQPLVPVAEMYKQCDGIPARVPKVYRQMSKPIDIPMPDKEFILREVQPCLLGVNSTEYSKDKVMDVWLDLIVVYRINIQIEDAMGAIAITKGLAKSCNLTEEEIKEAALANVRAVAGMIPFIDNLVPLEDLNVPLEGICIVTNENNTYGASVVMNPDVVKELWDKFGDVWVAPSSVHEMILIPKTISLEEIKDIVCTVNRTEVRPTEVLSDTVYVIKDGKIEIAG